MFSELPDHGMFVTFENEMDKRVKHRKVARQFSLLPTTCLPGVLSLLVGES